MFCPAQIGYSLTGSPGATPRSGISGPVTPSGGYWHPAAARTASTAESAESENNPFITPLLGYP